MSHIIAWQNPPHDWRDSARELAEELRANPGQWALVQDGKNWSESYIEELSYEHGLELRITNRRLGRTRDGSRECEVADLYARAPEEDR